MICQINMSTYPKIMQTCQILSYRKDKKRHLHAINDSQKVKLIVVLLFLGKSTQCSDKSTWIINKLTERSAKITIWHHFNSLSIKNTFDLLIIDISIWKLYILSMQTLWSLYHTTLSNQHPISIVRIVTGYSMLFVYIL